MSCGCPVYRTHTLNIKRESQFFLLDSPIELELYAADAQFHYDIKNGDILSLNLPEGNYTLQFHCSFRKKTYPLTLVRDTNIRIAWDRFSGKIEAWEISHL